MRPLLLRWLLRPSQCAIAIAVGSDSTDRFIDTTRMRGGRGGRIDDGTAAKQASQVRGRSDHAATALRRMGNRDLSLSMARV